MKNFQNSVFAIMFKGSPLLVTPIGDDTACTFLIDLEDFFILLEKHLDPDGLTFWTEIGKGITSMSSDIGKVIEEKNRNAYKFS